MKIRLALILTAVLPLMVACKPQDGSADATAPTAAATSETAPAAEAPATAGDDAATTEAATEQAEATPAANVPVPAQARLVGAEPVAGTDYVVIEGGQPIQPATGKIEVVEVFTYWCGHCNEFEPLVRAWQSKLPADVRFTAVPGAFGGHWDAYARAFYAAEQTGVLKRSHADVFKALHERGSLPMQNVSPDELATFYAAYGVQPQRYTDALRSEQTDARVKAARAFAMRVRVPGTPALVVNGKYLVKGRSFEDQLRIASALVERERAAARRR